MNVEFWVWLGVIVASVIIEMMTLDLVSIWFAFGAIIPFILSIFDGMPIWLEVVLFVLTSIVLIAFLRKVAQRWLYRNGGAKTNVDALTGKTAKLLEPITRDDNGSVKFNGVVWTAVSDNGQEIEAGKYVEVLKVDGNKLIVKLSKSKPSVEETQKANKKGELDAEEKGE